MAQSTLAPGPILLACQGPLRCNSGRHVLGLGRALHALGFTIQLAAPRCSAEERAQSHPLPLQSFDDYLAKPATEAPALVHLWTPRGRMLHFHQALCRHHHQRIRYLVHLEDNERIIAQDRLHLSATDYQALADGRLTIERVPEHLMHPAEGRTFLSAADGVTALVDTLLDELPIPRPHCLFWPGYEPMFEHPSPAAALRLRARLGVPMHQPVTAYTGNVHASNVAEVRSLYQAVARLNQLGQPLTLLRTGQDFVPLAEPGDASLTQHVRTLGELPRAELPALLRASDILIQPGEIDDWNRYRVPSKLPEYLAACRPVLLPRVNLGRALSHGDNALVVDGANAETITATLLAWLPRTQALRKIGIRGGLFARRELSWARAAETVAELYQRIL